MIKMTRNELLKIKLQIQLADCYYKYENACIDIEAAQKIISENDNTYGEFHGLSNMLANACIMGNEVKKNYYSKKRVRLQNKFDKLCVK